MSGLVKTLSSLTFDEGRWISIMSMQFETIRYLRTRSEALETAVSPLNEKHAQELEATKNDDAVVIYTDVTINDGVVVQKDLIDRRYKLYTDEWFS